MAAVAAGAAVAIVRRMDYPEALVSLLSAPPLQGIAEATGVSLARRLCKLDKSQAHVRSIESMPVAWGWGEGGMDVTVPRKEWGEKGMKLYGAN